MFEYLPKEMKLHSLSFLSARDLSSFARSNKDAQNVSQTPALWSQYLKRDFNITSEVPNLKLAYQNLHIDKERILTFLVLYTLTVWRYPTDYTKQAVGLEIINKNIDQLHKAKIHPFFKVALEDQEARAICDVYKQLLNHQLFLSESFDMESLFEKLPKKYVPKHISEQTTPKVTHMIDLLSRAIFTTQSINIFKRLYALENSSHIKKFWQRYSPFTEAVASSSLEILKFLLESDKSIIIDKTSYDEPSLVLALNTLVKYKSEPAKAVVELLLEHGANPDFHYLNSYSAKEFCDTYYTDYPDLKETFDFVLNAPQNSISWGNRI